MILGQREARRRLTRLQASAPLVATAARALARVSRATARVAAPHLLSGGLP